MKRYILVAVLFLVTVIVAVPSFFVIMDSGKKSPPGQSEESQPAVATTEVTDPSKIKNQLKVTVYRTKTETVETLPLESYVSGVIAAEMPVNFELEALKAQALAARTYIVRRLAEKDFEDVPEGAHVTDTIKHQVYLDDEQLHQLWGMGYQENIKKIYRAVVETRGKVITYQGKPINATFFSTSNGYTENSEEYWLKEIPYLRSTESPWDQQSPKFVERKKIPLQEFQSKLNVDVAVEVSTGQEWSEIMDYTTGERIAKVKVDDKIYTGRGIREQLNLNSADFAWEIKDDAVWITTRGYGHGVGMSQWGANGMAQEGKTAVEIVKHYYQGVQIEDYHQWVK